MSDRLTLTAIVPAYNAERSIAACLEAVVQSSVIIDEVIVYDDGSTDRTALLAQKYSARVISSPTQHGPAYGRNVAAAAAHTDLLFFVDSDVIIARNAIELLRREIVEGGAAAAFGSYDDTPLSQRASSLYVNLRHHFVHQRGAREAATFWSGMGLIRRDVFHETGGFDEDLFTRPSIEDVELGRRLLARGYRVKLVPEAQGKHWKDWRLWNLWRTDIMLRAYPWSRLIMDNKISSTALNLASGERKKAASAIITLLALLAGLKEPIALVAAMMALTAYIWWNRAFFSFLSRRMKATALLAAIVMHLCYHVYSSVTYAAVLITSKLRIRHKHRKGQLAGPRTLMASKALPPR